MLVAFGLTHQEAKLYIALHGRGSATGYEAARLTGISRSNAYAGLASLVDKGAAAAIDGKPQLYRATPVPEFAANHIRTLSEYRQALEQELVLVDEEECPYLTLRGSRNIGDKIKTVIETTTTRIYVAMPGHILRGFSRPLAALAARGVKVVVVTDGPADIPGAVLHIAARPTSGIRVIGDSTMTLTGELDGSNDCTCLYSMKKTLVNLIRDSIRNEIRVIEMSRPDA